MSGNSSEFEDKSSIEIGIKEKNRLETFVDAVFAIAITLLGLEFVVPTFTHSNAVFFSFLVLSWPKFVGYFLAFYLLGLFLINHHKQFINIECANEKLKLINFMFLAFIVLVPLATSVLTEYGDILGGVLFFDIIVLISGLILYLNWAYVKNHKYLLKKDITSRNMTIITYRNLSIPIAALIGIGLAFFTPLISNLAYLLIIVIILIAPKIQDKSYKLLR